jgi:hypothetical protein
MNTNQEIQAKKQIPVEALTNRVHNIHSRRLKKIREGETQRSYGPERVLVESVRQPCDHPRHQEAAENDHLLLLQSQP